MGSQISWSMRAVTGAVFKGTRLIKRAVFAAFLISASFLAAASPARCAIYYTSTTGLDSNPGTLASPWKTLKTSIGKLKAGDILYVRGGTYVGDVSIDVSGTASAPIAISAYNGEVPVIDGQNTYPLGDWTGLLTLNGNYIVMSGFEVKNTNNRNAEGVYIVGHHNTISHFNIHGVNQHGVQLEGDYGIVEDSEIWDASRTNLNGSYSGSGGWATGLSTGRDPVNGITDNAILRRNVVHNVWGEGLSSYESNGTLMENNTVYDTYSVSAYISDSPNVIFRNNLVYMPSNPAIKPKFNDSIFTIADELSSKPRSTNIQVYNNLFIGGIMEIFNWTLVSGSGLSNTLFANNTVVNSIFQTGSINSGSSIKNNIFYRNDGGALADIPSKTGLTFSNNLWSSAPPANASGAGDVIGDPLLAKTGSLNAGSFTAGYFKLSSASSPAINKAVVLSQVTNDYFNTARGSSPDIGAHEYVSSSGGDTSAPTVPGGLAASGATSTTFILGWTASADNVGVAGYRLDVSLNSGFTSFVSGFNNLDVGNVTFKSVSGLSAGTAYYARLRAYDAAGNISANSAVLTATTLAASDTSAPTVPGGLAASGVSGSAFNLGWTASTDNVGVAGYRLDISLNSGFTSFVSGYNNLSVGNVTSKSVSGLSAGTAYYARLRAYDAAGNISANSAVLLTNTSAGTAGSFKVVGYLESWGASGFEDHLLYKYLTHVNYAFVVPTASGGLSPTYDDGGTQLNDLVARAHAAGVKVSVSVGGWNDGNDSAFRTIAASPSLRATLINNLYNYVVSYNLDGVDIDWEFPTGAETNYASLMSELSARMKNAGKLVTAAVLPTETGGVTSAVFPYVDFIVIMAYNMGNPHSTESGAQSALTFWANQGLPKEKRVLGVPFYGRNSAGTEQAYSDLVAACPTAPNMNNNGSESCNGYSFNGKQTIKDKMSIAGASGGGAGIWAVDQDTLNSDSLLQAIGDALGGGVDTASPTTPGGLTASGVTGSAFTLGWTASTDNVGVAGYRLDVSLNSGFTSFVSGYNNLSVGNVTSKSVSGLSAGTAYYVRLRAYDAAGNISANSAVLTATTLAGSDTSAPTVPGGLSAGGVSGSAFTLGWTASTDNVGVAGYRLDVSLNSGFTSFVSGYNNLDVGNVISKSVSGLSAGTAYYVRLRAYDAAGNISANSAVLTATTLAASDTSAPTVPGGLAASGVTGSAFTLGWTASTDNVGVAGYRLDVSLNSGFTSFVSGYNNLSVGNVTSKSVSGLSAGTAYYARLRAYDAAGNISANSAVLTATTLAAVAGAYYVSPSGLDSNPGTLASPWKTLKTSIGKLKAGNTLYVRGGTYVGDVPIDVSGTASAPI
ncbi:MAG: glycosyl hydrolase family 18 protein, partial [Elusimicrobiales bacterium]